MAESKKVSELDFIGELTSSDEFLVIDKSSINSGDDSGSEGKTAKVTLGQIKDGLVESGLPSGEKGEQGDSVKGSRGEKGIKGQLGETGPAPTITYNSSTKTLSITT
mgnify:CR=1 FL=1